MCLAFLLMRLLDSKFWTPLGMIHKLLDGKIATFTIFGWFHKEEIRQASHMLTGKSYSCFAVLTYWGYVSVYKLDVTINVSVDALLVNELVSHFWDLETAQWYCRCLHGIVDVACVASLCFYLLCVVCLCCGWCFFQKKRISFLFCFAFLGWTDSLTSGKVVPDTTISPMLNMI